MPAPPFLAQVRTFYDELAVEYVERMSTFPAAQPPVDRAMLAAFAEHVRESGGGPVADIGCGAGYVAEYLAGLALDLFGVDLSPAMLGLARAAQPELRFVEGSLTALPLADACLAGALAWYSLIHIPPEHRPAVIGELARVVAAGGHLLVGFQAGTDIAQVSAPDGRPVTLGVHRLDPDEIAAQLTAAGFHCAARLVREPAAARERTPQAFLLARRA